MADRRAPRPSRARLHEEISAIAAELVERRSLSEQSLPRVLDLMCRFEQFSSAGLGVGGLADVSRGDVLLFVEADSASASPSLATMHLRRTVLRLLFRVGRELGLCDGDPTLDLRLPAKTVLSTRPLDNEEIALCRNAALHTLTSTRLAAAWALAESTARTAELPRLTLGDLDLRERRVWIHGSSRTEPRSGALSPWAVTQLARHVDQLPSMDDDQPLVYRGAGSATSKQASACMVISEVLARAGLANERDIRPLSVVAWAGRTILDETGRIDEVARRLGMRSLDRAAALVGLDWQNR